LCREPVGHTEPYVLGDLTGDGLPEVTTARHSDIMMRRRRRTKRA
jgi:hypothetical protein